MPSPIKGNKENLLTPCIKAAKIMHQKFSEIDQIAWDVIPSDKRPIILEGNIYYSLLVPQCFSSLEQNEL